jgi:hypothetical protein
VGGYLTPTSIQTSIDANHGKPLKLRTTGDGEVTFSRKGKTLTVTSSDGIVATLAGTPILAGNGAALPIDTMLKKLP